MYTNTHIWNLERCTDEIIFRAAVETQTYREQTYGHGAGVGRGWDVWREQHGNTGGDICISMADSCCCLEKPNNTLKQLSFN